MAFSTRMWCIPPWPGPATSIPMRGRRTWPISRGPISWASRVPRASTTATRARGLACALVFLSLNGFELHVAPKELYTLTMKVATGQVGDPTVAAYFRDRMSRKDA